MIPTGRLWVDGARLSYGNRIISGCLDLAVPDTELTTMVGPSSHGKSTLLKALTRLLKPTARRVILDDRDIHNQPTRRVARRIGILSQSSMVPDGITASELVTRGRFPHQGFARRWALRDGELAARAMDGANVTAPATRRVDELSGGQHQRARIAVALAQDTPILLLDEPTTFLDIRHQMELIELLANLNRRGRCLVAVLHDLSQTARFSTHLIAIRAGETVTQGPPSEVVTPGLVGEILGLPCVVTPDSVTRSPRVTPIGRIAPLNHEGPT